MPAAPKNDEPKFSRVALEKIWAETIQKEQKAAQGYNYTSFFLNPYKLDKMSGLTDKPHNQYGIDQFSDKTELIGKKELTMNNKQDQNLDAGKSYFDEILNEKSKRPRDKYEKYGPITTSMDYGWYDDEKTGVYQDSRLNFGKNRSEITKFMDVVLSKGIIKK